MRFAFPVILLAGCASPPPAFEEHLISTIPPGLEVRAPIAFSPNGVGAAYMARAGHEEWYAVRGTWKSRRLDFL